MTTDPASEKPLTPVDAAAVSAFCRRVRAALGDQIVELRLFGSKARGDAGPNSDIDVFVVVDAPARWPSSTAVSDIAFDVNLEHEVFISPVVVTRAMVSDPVSGRSPPDAGSAYRGRLVVNQPDTDLARRRLQRARMTLDEAGGLITRGEYHGAIGTGPRPVAIVDGTRLRKWAVSAVERRGRLPGVSAA